MLQQEINDGQGCAVLVQVGCASQITYSKSKRGQDMTSKQGTQRNNWGPVPAKASAGTELVWESEDLTLSKDPSTCAGHTHTQFPL